MEQHSFTVHNHPSEQPLKFFGVFGVGVDEQDNVSQSNENNMVEEIPAETPRLGSRWRGGVQMTVEHKSVNTSSQPRHTLKWTYTT